MSFTSFALGFANELKSRFSQYDLRILMALSTIFVRQRIRHINFLKAKEKKEKKEAKEAARAEKEAREAKEGKHVKGKKSSAAAAVATTSMNLRSRTKVGQFAQ